MAINDLSQWIDVKDLEDYLGPNGFYGFGNLASCKYLFIGPEFGGCASLAETRERIKAWKSLNSKPCVDARSFHRKTGEFRWFGRDDKSAVKVRIQKTYGTLIRLLPLVWNNDKALDRELVREYQRAKFGLVRGDDCFIEVSAIQREGEKSHSPVIEAYGGKVPYKARFLCDRVKKIQEIINSNKNVRAIIVYGSALNALKACPDFSFEGIKKRNILIPEGVPHPAAWGRTSEFKTFVNKIREGLLI